VFINSLGLLINIYNNFRLRRFGKAMFGKTGLSGALFFWYAIFFVIKLATGGKASVWDILGFGLPLLFLFFGEAIERIFERKKPIFEDGLFTFIVHGIVEILESFSYYVSNTASFLRVGAFALSHAVLSFVVFSMGDLLRQGMAGGLFLQIIVVIVGNLVILVLEGMVVTIQVVRLQYYEFFSKFFTETGTEFKPFDFRHDIKE
jgi:V/A-type H+-transporting ATPase subunit I